MDEIDKIASEITEDISVGNGLKKPANWLDELPHPPQRRISREFYGEPIFEQGPGRIPPPTEIIELPIDGTIRLVPPKRRPVAVIPPRPAPTPVVESADSLESMIGKLGARKLSI